MASIEEVTALVGVPDDTLSTEEIEASVAGFLSLNSAAASLCRRIASFYASRTDVKAGGAEVKSSQSYMHWLELSRDFAARATAIDAAPIVGATPGTLFDQAQFDNDGLMRGDYR